jgi:hypothetical protein
VTVSYTSRPRSSSYCIVSLRTPARSSLTAEFCKLCGDRTMAMRSSTSAFSSTSSERKLNLIRQTRRSFSRTLPPDIAYLFRPGSFRLLGMRPGSVLRPQKRASTRLSPVVAEDLL